MQTCAFGSPFNPYRPSNLRKVLDANTVSFSERTGALWFAPASLVKATVSWFALCRFPCRRARKSIAKRQPHVILCQHLRRCIGMRDVPQLGHLQPVDKRRVIERRM